MIGSTPGTSASTVRASLGTDDHRRAGETRSGADDREVDLGVQSTNSTAMIAAITTTAAAGLPILAMRARARRRSRADYTRAVKPVNRSAARSSVSCFLQNANRIVDFPRPAPA